MSEREFQHEPDDELLSAYLDDELSAEERAAVEARLANDPDAQQLLHQLRSVSQSVQAMPQVPAARDFRAEILRRTAALKSPTSELAGEQKSPLVNMSRSLPIFQSRRSWFWASLALAAGLLIMVLLPGDERGKKLPTVAELENRGANRAMKESSDRETNHPAPGAAADSGKLAKSESAAKPTATNGNTVSLDTTADKFTVASEKSAEESQASKTPDTSTVAALPPADRRDESTNIERKVGPADAPASFAGRLVDERPATAAPAAPAASPSSTPFSAAPAGRISGAQGGGGAFAGGAAKQVPSVVAGTPQPAPADAATSAGSLLGKSGPEQDKGAGADALVVVHVAATAEAFKNKSFDQLLRRNSVVVESEQLPEAIDRSGGESIVAARGKLEPSGGKLQEKEAAGEAHVDVVLVEAPEATIASCLAELKKDAENFPGVKVEPAAEARNQAEVNGALSKRITTDFGQYSRGIVPEQQKDHFLYQYYQEGTTGGARSDDAKDALAPAAADQKLRSEESRQVVLQDGAAGISGRARRLSATRNAGALPESSVGASAGTAAQANSPMRRAPMAMKAGGDSMGKNVRVLFVLGPEQATGSSTPAVK